MAKAKKSGSKRGREIKLIVSDSPKPSVALEAGTQVEVVSVSLIKPTGQSAGPMAARLCGGTSTCIALIKIDQS